MYRNINCQNNTSKNGGRSKGPDNAAKEAWKQATPFPIAEDIQKLKVAVSRACACKTQLEAALVYASHGIPVFPCEWQVRTKQTKKGTFNTKPKGPLIELGKGGLYLATIDPTQIKSLWTRFPEALIGVPMGRRVGFWALDVDNKDAHGGDGLDAWKNLEIRFGAASTRSHWTGTNGLHNLYLWDSDHPIGCTLGKLPKGMETKGEGGYVIFPPSPYEREGQTVSYRVSNDSDPEAGLAVRSYSRQTRTIKGQRCGYDGRDQGRSHKRFCPHRSI